MVRTRGLEPPTLAGPDPKSGASAIPPRALPICRIMADLPPFRNCASVANLMNSTALATDSKGRAIERSRPIISFGSPIVARVVAGPGKGIPVTRAYQPARLPRMFCLWIPPLRCTALLPEAMPSRFSLPWHTDHCKGHQENRPPSPITVKAKDRHDLPGIRRLLNWDQETDAQRLQAAA